MIPEFESLLIAIRPEQMRTVALACATDAAALQSLATAYKMGFARAILCAVVVRRYAFAQVVQV